jgi:hypothetical protein
MTEPTNQKPKLPTMQKSPATKSRGGKSRFATKDRGKKHQKPVAPKGPAKAYTSACCSLPARKPQAFSAISGKKDKTGLGHWRCSGCGKSTKVTVGKAGAEVPIDAAVTAVAVAMEVPLG